MKIAAIDYGTKRIGVALSDETQTLAKEYGIFSPKEFWQVFPRLLEAEEVATVIVGLPLNMSGQETEKTVEAKEFARQIEERQGVSVELVDERLSSQMAQTISGSTTHIDSLAAQLFLQNYLDKNKN